MLASVGHSPETGRAGHRTRVCPHHGALAMECRIILRVPTSPQPTLWRWCCMRKRGGGGERGPGQGHTYTATIVDAENALTAWQKQEAEKPSTRARRQVAGSV